MTMSRRHARGLSWASLGGALVLALAMLVMAAARPAFGSPDDELGLVRLGERLFFDTRLSADGTVSCATCHRPDLAFQDGRQVAVGVAGRTGTRNTPSLLDVAQQTSLFWDGRRDALASQALDPLLNPVEHGLASEAELLMKLRLDAGYVRAARAAGGGSDGLTVDQASAALAAFQRTLVSGPTPFDRFRAGNTLALSAPARRGWQLFTGAAQCGRCHLAPDEARPLFTDHQFHSLAVGLRAIERKLPELTTRLATLRNGGARLDHSVLSDPDMAALGRYAVTLDPQDIGKFKTPGLRNVALTAPYMHDGSIETLADAIDHEIYYRGTQDGRPLILTPAEREDLLAFLQALTSDVSPAAHTPSQGASAPSRSP